MVGGSRSSSSAFLALLVGLCPVVASETSFINRCWDVWTFDFKDRARLSLSEESRAERFLKLDVRFVDLIVRHFDVLYPPERLGEKNVSAF